jgi:hypothetical protein
MAIIPINIEFIMISKDQNCFDFLVQPIYLIQQMYLIIEANMPHIYCRRNQYIPTIYDKVIFYTPYHIYNIIKLYYLDNLLNKNLKFYNI